MHLTPLSAVVQMRPNFDYLDKADVRHRAEAANTSLGDGGESSQDEAEEDPTPVSMKVSRGESEEFKARRMASYEYVNQKREEERWIKMTYFSPDSGLGETERQQLQAAETPRQSHFKISPQEYLHALIPPSCEDKRSYGYSNNETLVSLATGWAETKKANKHINEAEFSDEEVDLGLDMSDNDSEYELEGIGGSESDSEPEVVASTSGAQMWKFTHCKYVVRKDISSIVQLPSDDVKEILEKMSRLKAKFGWEFMYDYDREFCERFPEIVQRQRNKWALLFHSLEQHFKMPKDGDKKALELELVLLNQQPTERHRSRRLSSRSSPRKRTLSGRSQSDVSDMEMDAVADAKNLSGSGGAVGARGRHISGETQLVNGAILTQNGGRRSRSNSHHSPSAGGGRKRVVDEAEKTGSEDVAAELERFVREQLARTNLLLMSVLRSQMSLYTARTPTAHRALSGGVSDKAIEDAVLAVGGFRLNNQWPPNSKPEAIFSSYTGNPRIDQMKKILFGLFEESPKVRSALFRTAAKTEGLDLSENECKKFLKDHCDSFAAAWYLKGAYPAS
ncbi:DNA-directed RNA polymerase III subunit RPC5 [Elysia marginata]|uniref:DNA-directed RNA polymerase III subunit RPC5 n=1 Tax=Elysia marginata TaxID=1093978 RepID=A0AAV4GWI8_9GAST|nr:DNA-directed RNA polymerase III subunit RPC5 [Elysia marginata]